MAIAGVFACRPTQRPDARAEGYCGHMEPGVSAGKGCLYADLGIERAVRLSALRASQFSSKGAESIILPTWYVQSECPADRSFARSPRVPHIRRSWSMYRARFTTQT